MPRLRLDRQNYPDRMKLALARQLRHAPTPAERFAWSLLRDRQVLGLKFRRQQVLRGFIVDFYCPHLRLIIELDGDSHNGPFRAEYDRARTTFLEACGYRLVRLRNRELTRERLEEVLRPFVTTP